MTGTREPLRFVSPAERDAHWPLKGLELGSGSPVPVIRQAHRLPHAHKERRPSFAYRLLTAVVALECIGVLGWVFLFWLPGPGS